jgi:hypothetical protein
MFSLNENTSFSHKVAIGLWHFVCTFITLCVLVIFLGSPLSSQITLVVITLLGLVSFILGFSEIQDPIVRFYSIVFKLIL